VIPFMNEDPRREFEREFKRSRSTLLRGFFELLQDNKKWWMLPIVTIMLLFAVLMVLSNSAAASFIYSLF
jgi:hypothetical protein